MILRSTFNMKPDQYEKSRPKYPEDIFKEISRFKRIDEGTEILEIGCGTGIATGLFAGSNANILCTDIGDELISIAKEKFRAMKNISFLTGEYESLEINRKFDLIYSATAYHWIKQPEGDLKTINLLKKDGIFAVFRYIHTNREEGYFKESQQIYAIYFPEQTPKIESRELISRERFDIIHRKEYPWSVVYSSKEYISLISTFSDHLSLKENKRKKLFSELKTLIDTHYEGKIRKKYITVLELGKVKNKKENA